MEENLQPAAAALAERFSAQVREFRGDTSLTLASESIVAACRALRDEYGFDMLSYETAVDYWPQLEPRFHVVYQVRSIQNNLLLSMRVPVSGMNPSVPTIEGIYPN